MVHVVEVDDRGAVDLTNGWCVRGGTKHIDIIMALLQELKEQGTILVKWIPMHLNEADIFTMNVDSQTFKTYLKSMCSDASNIKRQY